MIWETFPSRGAKVQDTHLIRGDLTLHAPHHELQKMNHNIVTTHFLSLGESYQRCCLCIEHHVLPLLLISVLGGGLLDDVKNVPVASSLHQHTHTAPAGCGREQGGVDDHGAPCVVAPPHSSQPEVHCLINDKHTIRTQTEQHRLNKTINIVIWYSLTTFAQRLIRRNMYMDLHVNLRIGAFV